MDTKMNKDVQVNQEQRPALPENWRGMSATEKTRHLLARTDLPQFIQATPADKLYLLIHEIGVDSSLELFSHVAEDQWRGLMDLSCWSAGRIDQTRFSGWFQATSVASPEVATRLLKSVDEEFLVSILQGIATVEEKDLDKDFVPDNLEILPSPDGEFFILLPQGHPLAPYVIQSLRLIFAEDLLRGRRLLRACRTEINSQLTEQAFKFREARMADLGFLERDAAVEIFQPIPLNELRERLRNETDEETVPSYRSLHNGVTGIALYGNPQHLFLHRVLQTLPVGPKKTALEEHFTYLINRHCIACNVELSDANGVQVAATHTYAIVNLALESLVGENLEEGRRALEILWLTELYRAGYTRLSKIRRDAQRLFGRTGKFALFGMPMEPLLHALSAIIPSGIQGFTGEGEVILRPIATVEELEQLRASVAYATYIADTFRDLFGVQVADLETELLPGVPESQRETLTYRTLLLTGLANQILGRGFQMTCLGEADLTFFSGIVLDENESNRTLKAGIREALHTALEEALESDPAQAKAFQLFLDQSLNELQKTLTARPETEAIDSRFVAGIVLVEEPAQA